MQLSVKALGSIPCTFKKKINWQKIMKNKTKMISLLFCGLHSCRCRRKRDGRAQKPSA